MAKKQEKKYVYVEPNDYIPKDLYEKYFGKDEEEEKKDEKKKKESDKKKK